MKRLFAFFLAFLLLAIATTTVLAQSGGAGYFDIENNLRVWQNTVFRGQVNALQSLTVTNQLVSSNDVVVGDDLTVTDVSALAKVRYTVPTTQTLTADATITTTNSFLLLTAGGSIGTSNIGTCDLSNQGQLLVLENVSNTTITITDTGTLKLSGNLALAQWDSGALVCDGTNWVQLYEQDN